MTLLAWDNILVRTTIYCNYDLPAYRSVYLAGTCVMRATR